MIDFEQRLYKLTATINDAQCIIIGAGAGLSAAAGLTYSGTRFKQNFSEYINKYGMTDMYSAGFYPFKSPEAKWAYWSKHISINRYQPITSEVYSKLKKLVAHKEHFVITTNVDHQFYKVRFKKDKVFAPQGDYGKLQCATPCHDKLYGNESLISLMVKEQKDCLIPSALVPTCPKCGGNMDINIRIDSRFIEDKNSKIARNSYQQFVNKASTKPTVILEFGVGYNTPSIIKYPFEQLTSQVPLTTLVRINKDYPEVSAINRDKTIPFNEDVLSILNHCLK
jgi:NAD-dependent SIR2 family protein deacetylase